MTIPRTVLTFAILVCVMAAGCQFGPGTLPVSAAHYSDAVRVAQTEQLLINLVRLRYRDHPVFLSVTSISTQFELSAASGINGSIVESGPDLLGLSGGVEYAERPTITFDILSGDEFEREMLEPVSINTVALLAESGWRVDRVLRLTAESINGLKHAVSASGPTPSDEPEYRDFLEVVSLLQELSRAKLIEFEFELRDRPFSDPIPRTQLSGEDLIIAAREGIEFRRVGESDDYLPVLEERRLTLRVPEKGRNSTEVARLQELLGLDPDLSQYDVVSRDDAELGGDERLGDLRQIVIDTRSLQGVLYFLSQGVVPPPMDLDNGVATTTRTTTGEVFEWSRLHGGLFRVASSQTRPVDAAAAVRHRKRWFWIRDDDEDTKSTFLLLRHLFTLQSGGRPSVKPVLTLPVGQ